MEKQLFLGSIEPIADLVQEISDGNLMKASGGIWTSTYINDEVGSEWLEWCKMEDFPTGGRSWILCPDDNVKVLTIDSAEDMHHAFDTYPRKIEYLNQEFLDYSKIAEEYDAFHITSRGQIETRFPSYHPNDNFEKMLFGRSLYGYDCESTHWFRWKFKNVEEVELKCTWTKR